MKLFPGNAVLAVLSLAALGASSLADLGPKGGARISPGGGLGKTSAPLPTWLGVRIAEAPVEITARLPIEPGTGLVVDQVMPGSPAAISGLQRNDVLARLNEQTLVTPEQLKKLVMHRKAGEQVEITFFRKGEKRKIVVVLLPQGPM